MEARWKSAREVLALVAAGSLQQPSPDDEARLDAFAGLYDAHIRAEEGIAYPAAQALLDEPARAAMGADMMQRRGAR
jgi:hypothetical protein